MKGIMKKSVKAKRKIAAVVLCAITLINIFTAAVEDFGTAVTVSFDGIEYSYETHAETVEEFFNVEEIAVKANDIVNVDMSAPITEDMRIEIDVAKYVTIYDDDANYGVITYGDFVEEILNELGIGLVGNDSSYPAKSERVYDGIEIFVSRAKKVTFTKGGESLEYYSYNKTVGEFLNEMGYVLSDDEKVVPEESARLTNGMTVAIRKKVDAMSPLEFDVDLSQAKVLICEATAYTTAPDECGPYSNGYTATGVKAVVGCVAVDPRVIPLKSKLYIETMDGHFVYGYCVAEDTGGAIKGNKVDLLMNTKSECFQFGRRQVKVYVLPA